MHDLVDAAKIGRPVPEQRGVCGAEMNVLICRADKVAVLTRVDVVLRRSDEFTRYNFEARVGEKRRRAMGKLTVRNS